jgi:hypothetical protein
LSSEWPLSFRHSKHFFKVRGRTATIMYQYRFWHFDIVSRIFHLYKKNYCLRYCVASDTVVLYVFQLDIRLFFYFCLWLSSQSLFILSLKPHPSSFASSTATTFCVPRGG